MSSIAIGWISLAMMVLLIVSGLQVAVALLLLSLAGVWMIKGSFETATSLLAQARDFDFGAVGSGTWVLLAFYAIAASVLATWLWLSGQKHVPASHSGGFTIAMPIAASLVGVLWLGEHFGALHGVAFACAAAGIVLIAWPRR